MIGQGPRGSAAHVQAELREAEKYVRLAKKAAHRAEQRVREVPPEVIRKHPWMWEYFAPIEEALRYLTCVKVGVEKALAIGEAGGREPATDPVPEPTKTAPPTERRCACGLAMAAHQPGGPGTAAGSGCIAFDDSVNPPKCSACGEPQFETRSGAVCRNGHGGADPVRCPNVRPGDVDCGSEDCVECTRARLERNARRSADEAIELERKKARRAPHAPKGQF